jgi:hypothetical protein
MHMTGKEKRLAANRVHELREAGVEWSEGISDVVGAGVFAM